MTKRGLVDNNVIGARHYAGSRTYCPLMHCGLPCLTYRFMMATATIKSSLDIIPFYGYRYYIKFYELPIFNSYTKLYGRSALCKH